MKSITIAFRKQKENKVADGTVVSLGSMSFEALRLSFGAGPSWGVGPAPREGNLVRWRRWMCFSDVLRESGMRGQGGSLLLWVLGALIKVFF